MDERQKVQTTKIGSALVVGGGIGGMQAALDLAASGIRVYLVEMKPSIGGVMSQLDKTFPTNDCAMCTMAPRLVEISQHKDIEIITLSDVKSISGEPGNFKVVLRKKPRYVNMEKCTGCGACVTVCPLGKIKPSADDKKPKPIPDEYNEGLVSRPAIYIPFPQAVPNKAVIDAEHCLYLTAGKCGRMCEKKCEAGAIDFSQKEEEVELNVGAVVLIPGYSLFDAKLKPDYGYGNFENVITSLQFERILSASGPFQGKILRPSDKTEPKRIAWIQCVGSRDSERDYCSAVCCMYATKEAIIAKEHLKGLECDIFYMDLRAYGKGFEEYYLRAREQGINYIRCRIPKVKEIPGTKNLIVEYFSEDGKKTSEEYGLVVLSVGMQPIKTIKDVSEKFKVNLNQFGFCETNSFQPVESNREGVYVAGPFTEPKDIPETVMQASAAASKVLKLLKEARGSLITPKEYPPEIDVSGQEPRIGVFVCHCGTNIAGVIDVSKVVEYAKTLPNVVFATDFMYTCSADSCEEIKKLVKEHNLNRVVVAACTPRTHEPLFQGVIREAGLNPYLFEMANIRDQNTWVHSNKPEEALRKAKDLVRMAVAKARLLEPLQKGEIDINKSALVIGGGLAGMTAAVELAEQGFNTYLIEKEAELGGNLRRLHYLLGEECDPQEKLKSLIEKVKSNDKIHLFTNAKIESVEGSVGNFKTRITTNHSSKPTSYELEHGVIIVATGAKEYKPNEYLYGEDERVITQLELEEKLAISRERFANNRELRTVVMIQCVGSRDKERPYCSRVCCAQAIKNALKIKEKWPDTSIYILYRDVRTYGFKEKYYSEAREKGVVFMIYGEDRKPEVVKNGNALGVRVFDQTLKLLVEIPADLVVLSTGIVSDEENKAVAQLLKLPVNQNNFFLEAHIKLRPVDFATDGIFVCGLAHFPKGVDETIIQACAAAARSSTILSKDKKELQAKTSFVVDENCDGCAYCVDPCPYKAITLIEYMYKGAVKKTVEVNTALCQGCGVCMATCPKKGCYVRNFSLEQLSAMVEAALERSSE